MSKTKYICDAEKIWNEYQSGTDYNTETGLYETVRKNEDYFIGRQWKNQTAKFIDRPVFNLFKRVINYFVSVIVSDDIGVSATLFPGEKDSLDEKIAVNCAENEIARVLESSKIRQKLRLAIRNAAVDGDACIHLFYNKGKFSGQSVKGEVDAELIDNTSVFFGNPQCAEVQSQPYIIISSRDFVSDLREEAAKNGISDTSSITADSDENYICDRNDSGKCTVLTRYYKNKVTGTVHYTKTVRGCVIRDDTDTGYKLYPIAYFQWEHVKNSYHGQAAITGMIPNQNFVNKLYAMAMEHIKKMAFPKLFYDISKLPDGVDNTVGAAIGVQGSPQESIISAINMPDMSGQVMQLIAATIDNTRELMGVNDAALGNVDPKNTSAIIATQKAAAVPLELQKQDYYQFVEDIVFVVLDIISQCYGVRYVRYSDASGVMQTIPFDFSVLSELSFKLDIDIGAAAYFSETMQIQTLDNLYSRGIIQSPEDYLDMLPDGCIKNKRELIEKCRKAKAEKLAQEQYQQHLENQEM